MLKRLLTLITLINLSVAFAQDNTAFCPTPTNDNNFFDIKKQTSKLIEDVEKFIKFKDKNNYTPEKIHKIDYKRSQVATYCKRPLELINTIVIHHTAMRKESTPQFINKIHLSKGIEEGDPWYMIGYNYVISQSYSDSDVVASSLNPQVFEGRPPHIRGAHAGGHTKPLSDSEKKYYEKFKIQCGNETQGFKEVSALDQINGKGGISGNLVSFGVALIGNYERIKYETIDGIRIPVSINRSPGAAPVETPSFAMLGKTAKFICDIQKKHPNVKKIVPHSYFKATDCPGTLIYQLYEIKARAKLHGCNFTVEISK